VRLLSELKSSMKLEASLRKALGMQEPPEPPSSLHPPGSKRIGRGRAADGTRYEIWLPPSSSQHPSDRCDVTIDVEENEAPHREGRLLVGGGGGAADCLSRSHPAPVTLSCEDGRFRVEGQTKPAARRARLRLVDGRTIASNVAIVPAAAGGPMGFYLQLVPRKGPAPVSLTELDKRGKAIATIRFKHVRECIAHPLRPPEPLPGGTRTLARGRIPGGPRFAIRGERYRFMGHVHFRLTAGVASESGPLSVLGSASGSTTFPAGPGSNKRSPFHMEQESGCQPREYALLYGILRKPVAHQNLRSQARELRERCEGEAEG
jgi:hypothetical protein